MKKLFLTLAILMFAVNGFCASEWDKDVPLATDAKIDWPTISQTNNEALDRLVSGFRQQMRLNYSSATTISVSSGQVVCSNSTGTVRKFRSNTSATNVTFSDLDTGTEQASTTYYVYAVSDADATTATFKISASSSAPTGVTYYKRLGSFLNNASSNITLIDNDSEEWEWGEKVSKTVTTVYQALTDGILVATVDATADDTGTSVLIYSDSANPPTTVLAESALGGGAAIDPGSNLSISAPIKAGDYYKVTMSNNSASSTIYFFPKQ